jgi:hypothetical protein
MNNERKTFLGLQGIAFVVLAGMMAANCGGTKPANPVPSGSAGSGGKGGAGGSAGKGGTTGTGGAAGGAPDASASGTGGGAPDASAGDGGDAAMSCDPSAFPVDAGCTPCSANPLFACGMGFVTTCIPFDNSTIPANVPRL